MLVGIDEAIGMFPMRDGKPPHVKSVRKRITHGVGGVRLKAIKHSGRWYTTAEWVEQFIEEYTRRAVVPTRLELERETSRHIERARESLSRRMRRGKGKMPSL